MARVLDGPMRVMDSFIKVHARIIGMDENVLLQFEYF